MKTKTSLHFFFSLCLLSLCSFIWGGNLLSAQTTVTSTFTNNKWGVGTGEPEWTGSNTSGSKDTNYDRGISFGKNKGTLTLTSKDEHSNVTKVVVVASANGTAGKLSVTVGGTTVGSTLTIEDGTANKNKKYSFETASPISGTIIVTASEGKHTIWIKSISITTGVGSGEGGGSTSAAQDFDFTNSTEEVYSDKVGTTLTNALTGEAKGDVTYTSNDEAVATVDPNSGEVTIKGVGTATITATAAEITEEGTKYEATIKRYTLNVWPTTIAELKSITTSTTAATFKAKLTDAYITYVPDASNAYLQDASGAILIYKSGHGLKAGNCYTGEISGSTKKYYGLNEITAFDFSKATPTTKSDIVPEEVSLAELSTNFAHYESKYIKVTEVTASGTVKSKGSTCQLTQEGTAYSSPELRAAAVLTDGITDGTTYPAIIVFPSYFNTTKQLNLWSDDLVTLPAGTLKTPNVNFGAESYEVPVKEAIELPFYTDSDGDVTYKATPSETITLTKTANGVSVTATATGTFTITANVAETANFAAGSTSTTLTVTPPASNLQNVVLYKKVTSTDEIVDGSVYLIVNEENKTALGTNSGDYCDKVSISFTETETVEGLSAVVEGLSAVNEAGSPYEVTFSKSEDGNFYLHTAYGYLYRPQASSNYVRATTDKSTATTWECTISNGDATLYSQNGTYKGYLRYNSGSPRFSCYDKATSQKAIQLYQKVGELKAHGVMGGYASYAADFAYIMPEGLMGKIVYLDGNKLTTDNIYAGGTEVPALTPLLIRTYETFSGTDKVKTYYPVVLDKEVAANAEVAAKNALEYRRAIVDGKYMTSSLNFAEGCRYYKLSVDNKGENPGFYYGDADGAAFEMKNGSSAYLTVPASLASPALLFDDNEITGIENLTPAQGEANNGAVYNLQGVRMNGKNLQKGLYIINGKKVVIK